MQNCPGEVDRKASETRSQNLVIKPERSTSTQLKKLYFTVTRCELVKNFCFQWVCLDHWSEMADRRKIQVVYKWNFVSSTDRQFRFVKIWLHASGVCVYEAAKKLSHYQESYVNRNKKRQW